MRDRLLVVDGNPISLRVMDVSLRSAGFDVETATNGLEAWALLEGGPPDLIMADTDLSGIDGFELCLRLRKSPLGAGIPFIFLTADKSLEHKIRSLAAGANDYLVKPAYIKEVVARVRALLQRRDRERLGSDQDGSAGRDRFAGSLADITVVDLVQLIEGNGRSGMAHLHGENGAPAAIYFRHGRVVDAEVGRLSGIDAMSRLFSWSAGSFELEWRSIRRKDAIERPPSDLVVEGMRRLDEWNRLLGAIPDPNAAFEVDYKLLAERLAEIPDEVNGILRLCDGLRTIRQVVEDCAVPDVEALTALIRLRDEGIIHNVSAVRGPEPEPGSSRFPAWLGARSSPFSSGPSGAVGSTGTGIGSGPVEQSFAERLQVEAQGAVPTTFPTEEKDVDLASRSPRRPTAPGLGQAVTAAAAEAAKSTGVVGDRGESGIPEPRPEQDNLVKFPRQGDSRPVASVPMDFAPANSEATSTAQKSVSVDPGVGIPPAVNPARDSHPSSPIGRPDGMAAHHAEATTSQPTNVAPPSPQPVNAASTSTGPTLLTDTYRGFGPKPGQVEPRSPPMQTETPERSSKPASESGRVVESNTVPLSAAPNDVPLETLEARAPTGVGSAERTLRVSFPDDEITRGDALDELGLPSRWRGMRVLALAALAGALAAVGVYRFRAGKGTKGEGVGHPTVAVVVPMTAPHRPSVVLPSSTPQVPPLSTGPSPNILRTSAPNAASPRAPEVELPSPVGPPIRTGPGSPSDHVPSVGVRASGPNSPTPGPAQPAPSAKVVDAPSKAEVDFPRQLSDCRAAFARNKLRDALSACSAAVEANPSSAEALTMLAHTELSRGRLARASELAAKAVTLDPNLADAYVIIGGARQDSGQNREAKAAYHRYLQLAPQGRYADELRSIVNTL